LLGGTLEGHLIEIDLVEKSLKRLSVDASGAGIWDLKAVNYNRGSEVLECSSLIACACDDGTLRLFGIRAVDNECCLVQTYPQTNCRLLSLAWHKQRFIAVGGSDGYMSYWDVVERRELFSINGKVQNNLDVNIWSLGILENGDVVSGDSSGSVRIWDGKYGSLLKSFNLHKKDVLALALSKGKIYSSGVDGQVNLLTNEGKEEAEAKWMFKGKKRPHSHDVMALAISQNTLFSGGNDTRLLSYSVKSFLEKHPFSLQVYSEVPHIQVSDTGDKDKANTGAVRMICQQQAAVEVWEVNVVEQEPGVRAKLSKGKEGEPIESKTGPKLLAVLNSKSNVFSSSVSSCGKHVVYSNMTSVHLYELARSNPRAPVEVRKVKTESAQLKSIQFTPNGKFIVGLNSKNECCVYDAATLASVHVFAREEVRVKGNFPPSMGDELLAISGNSELIAVTDKGSAVLIFNLSKKSLHGVVKVEHVVSSLCFQKESNLLLLGMMNRHVLFYEMKTCTLSQQWTGHTQQVAKRLNYISGSIEHMSCSQRNSNNRKQDTFVMLNTVRGLCFVNFGRPTKELKMKDNSLLTRKRKHNHGLQLAAQEGQNPRILPLEHPCLFACFLGRQSALIVECPWLNALQHVSQPLQRKVYGHM
jgi:U3 small nucleolar RNA-associated protein 4